MKKTVSLLLICCFLILPACTGKSEREFFAMNTYMALAVYGNDGALDAAEAKIKELDAKFSITGAAGEVFKLNREGALNTPSAELIEMLECARILYERTDGMYDITTYSLKKLWQRYEIDGVAPTDAEIAEALALVGMNRLLFDESRVELGGTGGIDLGSIVKGYAGREAVKILKNGGAGSGLLTLGGNVAVFGKKPDGGRYRIGITDPFDTEKVCGYVEVEDASVVTSGKYRRALEADGERFNHIINARTGRPCNNGVASVTVICDDGMWADALSTALFLLGEQGAIDYYNKYGGFEAVIIMEDGRIVTTSPKCGFVAK